MFPSPQRRQMQSDDGVHKIAWPGTALMGAGFDEIIMEFDPASHPDQQVRDWFYYSVRCRLFPGGKMHILNLIL